MATTLNLPYKRFVRQVSNGCARTKYSYQAMQTDLLAALKAAPWHAATCEDNEVTTVLNKVTETDREVDSETGEETSAPSYTAYLQDRYDAFKQGGDAVTETASFCGYAGMVAYRYKLPATYDQNISSVTMRFSASRYLRSGLKVVIVLSDSASPSEDWATVRGTASGAIATASTTSEAEGVKTWGFAAQDDVNSLMGSTAREATLTMTATDYAALGTSTRYDYLWVYVSVEDYEDWWVLYDAKTPRYYSIEGSAALVGGTLAVTFAGDVTADSEEWIYVRKGFYLSAYPDAPYPGTLYPKITQTWATQWGNFLYGICVSSLHILKRADFYESNCAVLSRIGIFPRKDFFSFSSEVSSEQAAGRVPYSEVGVFAANRNEYTWNSTDARLDPVATYYNDIHASLTCGTATSRSSLYNSDGVSYPAVLRFAFATGFAPGGAISYNRIKLVGTPNSSNMTIGVNVWRSQSPDASGPFGRTIASVLCSHQEMFTASETKVSASLEGDGTTSTGMTLSMDAELVGYVPVPSGVYSSSTDMIADLTVPVRPGDCIILCPKIESVDYEENCAVAVNLTGFYLS